MDLTAVALLVSLVSVSLSADNAGGKARSCVDVRSFYNGKGFTLSGVPQSEISVLYRHPPDVWIPMWFERACAGAHLQQYVVPVGHVTTNTLTTRFVGFPQGCSLGVKKTSL
ncbi:hypothetical protein PO909_027556 [Leuciscus waleckii]